MGAGFDRVARAIASDMPRRKVLKFLVGGAIASVGTSIMGEAASAAPGDQPSPLLMHLNNTFPPIHGKPPININRTGPPVINFPYPPVINIPYPPISINVTYP